MHTACLSFFFSSRRRHTRWTGDWSSDVCSSDLGGQLDCICLVRIARSTVIASKAVTMSSTATMMNTEVQLPVVCLMRSEERRVGKECRYWWSTGDYKKKLR